MCRVLDRGHPVIFCGESGSGKSTAVNAMVHGNFQMQPDRSLTIVLVSKTISEVDPLHAEQVVQDAMSQFFFGKHRRTIDVAIRKHKRPPWHDRLLDRYLATAWLPNWQSRRQTSWRKISF
jgi:energy-coupling factor transporter ATP-binding protein EcfA2